MFEDELTVRNTIGLMGDTITYNYTTSTTNAPYSAGVLVGGLGDVFFQPTVPPVVFNVQFNFAEPQKRKMERFLRPFKRMPR